MALGILRPFSGVQFLGMRMRYLQGMSYEIFADTHYLLNISFTILRTI